MAAHLQFDFQDSLSSLLKTRDKGTSLLSNSSSKHQERHVAKTCLSFNESGALVAAEGARVFERHVTEYDV
ncbi:MAG: hypothetical protein ACQEUT_01905 [Bacillota bacterium]